MGKYLIQYFVPATILLILVVWGAREYYLRQFPKVIKNHIKVEKAHQKYEKRLKKAKDGESGNAMAVALVVLAVTASVVLLYKSGHIKNEDIDSAVKPIKQVANDAGILVEGCKTYRICEAE